jgi:hypothetical protein
VFCSLREVSQWDLPQTCTDMELLLLDRAEFCNDWAAAPYNALRCWRSRKIELVDGDKSEVEKKSSDSPVLLCATVSVPLNVLMALDPSKTMPTP